MISPVAHADGERTARAALADHDTEDRHREVAIQNRFARNRLTLVALLGAHAGIGARGVDERDQRQPEFLRPVSSSRSALR